MQHIKISDKIHILINNQPDRKKFEMEFMYSCGGSLYEKKQDRGRRHLLEHCIVDRTKDLDYKQLKEFNFQHNIDTNAYTSQTRLVVEASAHRDDFLPAFNNLLEMFISPTFTQKTLDKEKEIVLQEIVDRKGDPSYRLYYEVQKSLLTPDSYSYHQVLGSKKIVEKTTVQDLERNFNQMLGDSQLIFCFSGGGLDLEIIKSKLQEIVNKIPQNFLEKPSFKNTFFLGREDQAVISSLAHSSADFSIYIPISINLQNQVERKVFSELFFSYNSGVLYEILREEKQLIYSFFADFSYRSQELVLNMNCGLDKIPEIISSVQEVFGDFEKHFSAKNFEILKTVLTKKQDILSDRLSQEIHFAQDIFDYYNKFSSFQEYNQKITDLTQEKVYNFYQEVKSGLSQKKLVIVSQNEQAREVL